MDTQWLAFWGTALQTWKDCGILNVGRSQRKERITDDDVGISRLLLLLLLLLIEQRRPNDQAWNSHAQCLPFSCRQLGHSVVFYHMENN